MCYAQQGIELCDPDIQLISSLVTPAGPDALGMLAHVSDGANPDRLLMIGDSAFPPGVSEVLIDKLIEEMAKFPDASDKLQAQEDASRLA